MGKGELIYEKLIINWSWIINRVKKFIKEDSKVIF